MSSKNRVFKKWTFWLIMFDYTSNNLQYSIEAIGTINNLVNLHQYYRTLPMVHEIKRNVRQFASLAFFFYGIKPAWEDPKNKDGASYKFIVTEAFVDDVWRDLLLCASGELFDFKDQNELCGIIVSPKKERTNYEFDLWVKNYTPEKSESLIEIICNLESLKNRIKPENIEYAKHSPH
ncbi:hypothetical protein M9Y10_005041 [Tritrichomonas musculus]|uniref:Uncharacterized protein n=1 Tax=Tritrichomonas musculus TaxID=1915356 RepID=A0ABR2JLD9_9EUKA